MCSTNQTIHCFEQAGLGKAPFRFVGLETAADRASLNTQRAGDGLTYTTNYSTSCDYCGTAIQNAFQVVSSDGNRFKVGCECIRKSDDNGLIQVVNEQEKTIRRQKAKAKRDSKWQTQAALIAAFKRGEANAILATLPHPTNRMGCTAYDYVRWCVDNHYVGQAVYNLIKQSLKA